MYTLSMVRKFAAAAVLTLAVSTTAAHAGLLDNGVRVTVPFAFESGKAHLPAGVYRMTVGADHILNIRGAQASGLAMTQSHQTENNIRVSKVVFHRYGSRYFLRDIYSEGTQSHVKLTESKAEKEARTRANNLASIDNTPEVVEVSLTNAE